MVAARGRRRAFGSSHLTRSCARPVFGSRRPMTARGPSLFSRRRCGAFCLLFLCLLFLCRVDGCAAAECFWLLGLAWSLLRLLAEALLNLRCRREQGCLARVSERVFSSGAAQDAPKANFGIFALKPDPLKGRFLGNFNATCRDGQFGCNVQTRALVCLSTR